MAEQTITLLFNKISRVFAGYRSGPLGPEDINTDYYVARQETFDPATHAWSGDFETGKIIPKTEVKQIVTERQLQGRAQDKIFKKYKLSKQLNITTDVLLVMLDRINQLCTQAGIDPINEETSPELVTLNEMRYYIETILANNKRLTQAYIDNPAYEYMSIRDELKQQSDLLEGGLYELFPQEHSADTV